MCKIDASMASASDPLNRSLSRTGEVEQFHGVTDKDTSRSKKHDTISPRIRRTKSLDVVLARELKAKTADDRSHESSPPRRHRRRDIRNPHPHARKRVQRINSHDHETGGRSCSPNQEPRKPKRESEPLKAAVRMASNELVTDPPFQRSVSLDSTPKTRRGVTTKSAELLNNRVNIDSSARNPDSHVQQSIGLNSSDKTTRGETRSPVRPSHRITKGHSFGVQQNQIKQGLALQDKISPHEPLIKEEKGCNRSSSHHGAARPRKGHRIHRYRHHSHDLSPEDHSSCHALLAEQTTMIETLTKMMQDMQQEMHALHQEVRDLKSERGGTDIASSMTSDQSGWTMKEFPKLQFTWPSYHPNAKKPESSTDTSMLGEGLDSSLSSFGFD